MRKGFAFLMALMLILSIGTLTVGCDNQAQEPAPYAPEDSAPFAPQEPAPQEPQQPLPGEGQSAPLDRPTIPIDG